MGSRGDWDVPPNNLTAPPFAGPNDAAIEFGADPLPPELVFFYAVQGLTLVNAITFRSSSTNYVYLALVTNGSDPFMCAGHRNGAFIAEEWCIIGSASSTGLFNVGRGVGNGAHSLTLWLGDAVSGMGDFLIMDKQSGSPVSQARGMRAWVASAAATAVVGAGETVVLTSPSMVWVASRAYEVIESTDWSGSAANSLAFTIIRRNNVGGTVLGTHEFQCSPTVGAGQTGYARTIVRNNTGADITDNLVQTVQAAVAGTVVGAGGGIYMFLRYLEIRDIGNAADYPNATQI